MSITVVSFILPPEPGSPAAVIDALMPATNQLQMLVKSLRRVNGNVNLHVLTDAPRYGDDVVHHIFPSRIDPNQMMLGAAHAFARFFDEYDFLSPVVLVDPDILFFADIAPVFDLDPDFDIALTRRDESDMPFNSGIIFANTTQPDAVRYFFKRHSEIIALELMDNADWFADQLVLNRIMDTATQVAPDRFVFEGVRIKLLDANEYNYSPPREHPSLLRRPHAAVYHFKGRCRTFMLPFFEHFVTPGRFKPIARVLDTVRLTRERSALKEVFYSDEKRVKPKHRADTASHDSSV